MKLRLMICLFLLLITPSFAQQDDAPSVAYIHVFNSTTSPFMLAMPTDTRTIAPYQTTTFALPADTPLFLNEQASALEDIYNVGSRYVFVYLGRNAYTVWNLTDMAIVHQEADVTDADTSVWWIGNYFTDTSATLTVSVDGEPVLNLGYGDLGNFSAPIAYFEIAFSVGDTVLFSSSQAFGEPYYTSVVLFAGDYSGRMGRDYVPMVLDIIETDFMTWMSALTQADIAPYLYTVAQMLIENADAQAEFLADDRVILLPYDDAFNALAFDTRMYFYNDPSRLSRLLMNHLLVKSEMPSDPTAPLTTLAGEILAVQQARLGLRIEEAGYITRLLLPNLSEVWLIDGVLLPSIQE